MSELFLRLVKLAQLASEGPKKVRERERRIGGRGFMRYNYDNQNNESEDEIESVKGKFEGRFTRPVKVWEYLQEHSIGLLSHAVLCCMGGLHRLHASVVPDQSSPCRGQ